jgi:hypothetical protein
MYKESVAGVLGLAPPLDQDGESRHFLYQLKEKGVIEHLVFSIFVESYVNGTSDIKFGSYDTERIEEGHSLALINTVNTSTWAMMGKAFKVGSNVKTIEDGQTKIKYEESFLDGTRFAFLEPSSPFIYMPPADFVNMAR